MQNIESLLDTIELRLGFYRIFVLIRHNVVINNYRKKAVSLVCNLEV